MKCTSVTSYNGVVEHSTDAQEISTTLYFQSWLSANRSTGTLEMERNDYDKKKYTRNSIEKNILCDSFLLFCVCNFCNKNKYP
jgi:hypothetical protein